MLGEVTVKSISAPAIGLPPASKAVAFNVSVIGLVGGAAVVSEVVVVANERVEPPTAIWRVCWGRVPTLAVIVASWLFRLPVPDENVTLATPFTSVVAEAELNWPASVVKVTGTPAITALAVSRTVAETVEVLLLSDLTL